MTPERGLAVVGGEQVVPLGAEERRDHADQRTVVVDDENAGHQSAPPSGMLNANTLPVLPLTWSSYQRLPPWASTTRRQEKRPMPAPDTSSLPKRTNGSKIRRRSSGGTPGPSSATRTIARSFRLATDTVIAVPGGAYLVALWTRPPTTSAVRRLSPRAHSGVPARGPQGRCQPLGLRRRFGERQAVPVLALAGLLREEVEVAAHGRERRAQVVRHDRDEVGPRAVELAEALGGRALEGVERRLVDRERGLVGERAGEGDLGLGELRLPGHRERHDPDDAVAGDEPRPEPVRRG